MLSSLKAPKIVLYYKTACTFEQELNLI